MVWNGGSLTNSTNPAIVTAAGNYTVTATNATNGCSVIATTSVTAIGGLPSVSVVTPLQITCSAPTVTLTGSSITPGVTYSWSAGTTTATQTVNAIGNYTLTVTNTLTGCSSATVVAVTSNTTLPIITSATNSGSITCIALTSTVTGTSAGNTMVWNGGALTNATNPAIVTAAGNYTLTATNATNGCTTTSVVAVTSNTTLPVITSAINSGSITCTTLTSTLTGTSAGNTMVWNGGALVNATNPATVTAVGNYTLTSTNATNGCSSSSVVAVSGSTVLSISFSATPISGNAPLLVTCTNLSTGATSYTWDFSDNTNNTSNLTNENHTYANTGDYIITLNGIFGLCSGTSTVLIHVIDDSPLIIPNVFSPNNDGVNDAWEFKLKKASNCQLYDRWGLKLFETNTSTIKWEGRTSSGMPCVEGTYFYIINTYDSNDKAISLHGFVNLFR
jgi:gliding motility-associated-like protein